MSAITNPPGVAAPIGRYHHTRVSAGVDLVFVSGPGGQPPRREPDRHGRHGPRTAGFANLGVILEDLGAYPGAHRQDG